MAVEAQSGERAYGISGFSSSDEAELIIEELQINGFAVIENVLSPSEVEMYCGKLDEVYEKQVTEFGEEKLTQISDKNMVRCPLSYDESFLNLATNERVRPFIEKMLGGYYILHLQNGIVSHPSVEHHQAAWHRDLPYQFYVSSKPLAVNAYFTFCDYREETGGTMFLPHSHKIEDVPSLEYLNKHGVSPEASAGSVILFDSMVFHRAGYNSSNIVRRGINHVYSTGILKQQVRLPDVLDAKYQEDPYLAMLLGYSSDPASSVLNWREKRLSKHK